MIDPGTLSEPDRRRLDRIVEEAAKQPPIYGGWHYPEIPRAQVIAISVAGGLLAWAIGRALIR